MAELGGEGVRYLTGRRPASCLKDLVAIVLSALIRVTAWGRAVLFSASWLPDPVVALSVEETIERLHPERKPPNATCDGCSRRLLVDERGGVVNRTRQLRSQIGASGFTEPTRPTCEDSHSGLQCTNLAFCQLSADDCYVATGLTSIEASSLTAVQWLYKLHTLHALVVDIPLPTDVPPSPLSTLVFQSRT